MQQQCSGTNKTGVRCGGKALPGSSFCVAHDPDRVVEMAAWRKAGGQGKSNVKRAAKRIPPTLRGVEELLYRAMGEVAAGTMDPGPANALANLARALVAVTGVAEIESQIAALRQQIADVAS